MLLETISVPSLGKVGPVCHHHPGQLSLIVSVDHGGVVGGAERVSEHVEYLVTMHHPGPGWPWRPLCPVSELVEVYPEKKTIKGVSA